jgi:titin
LVQRATNAAFTSGVTNYPTVSANATGYVDSLVVANTQYYYRVRAENSNSYSAWTNVAPAKTAPVVVGVPLAPILTISAPITREEIPITWTNPTPPAVVSNMVQYSRTGPNGPWTTATPNGTSPYLITGLRNNTTYWIRVVAVNAAGQTASAVKSATTRR